MKRAWVLVLLLGIGMGAMGCKHGPSDDECKRLLDHMVNLEIQEGRRGREQRRDQGRAREAEGRGDRGQGARLPRDVQGQDVALPRAVRAVGELARRRQRRRQVRRGEVAATSSRRARRPPRPPRARPRPAPPSRRGRPGPPPTRATAGRRRGARRILRSGANARWQAQRRLIAAPASSGASSSRTWRMCASPTRSGSWWPGSQRAASHGDTSRPGPSGRR